jgi:hypothetical protein
MRTAPHGGLTPPRSCFAMRMSADEKTIFAIHIRTSAQERRASARRGSRIAPARTIPRTSPHDRHTQHQERRASARRGNETHLQDGSLCVQRTTPPAAAGVSPSWFENRTCADNSAHIPTRPSHAAPRAAGVSPPWVCKPSPQRQCDEFRRFEFASAMHPTAPLGFGAFTWSAPRMMSSHAESIPRGAYAPRSCFAMRTSADEKTIFAIHIRTSGQERQASARRGFVNRVRNGNAVNFGASNPHAECIPRGAYAPRSCFAMRTSADEKTIFAIHIRTSGQERRASAHRGSIIAPARTIPRTSPHDRHTQHQERRALARRVPRL